MPKPIVVDLSWGEVFEAAEIGVRRQIYALQNGLKQLHGSNDTASWSQHIRGALAERAFCKHLGVYHEANIGRVDNTDVLQFEIRSSENPTARLFMFKNDCDESPFVLVTGICPSYLLIGWCFGHEGKKDEYWSDPQKTNRWAYFVSRDVLRDCNDLPAFWPRRGTIKVRDYTS